MGWIWEHWFLIILPIVLLLIIFTAKMINFRNIRTRATIPPLALLARMRRTTGRTGRFRPVLKGVAIGVSVVVISLVIMSVWNRPRPRQGEDASAVATVTLKVFYIIAPVGKPSDEVVDTLRGARVEPEGLIWIVDQSGKPHQSGNDKEYPSPPMARARFQSRTDVPVMVKIIVPAPK